jgi:hypothetical protein
VSSILKILYLLIISTMTEPSTDVFPADLVPATSIVLEPSIRKLRSPAERGVIILCFMKRGKVHGLSLCRRKA